jgi:hypothetical protein
MGNRRENINIEICRIARRNGEVYIDCIINCHPDYHFTNLQVVGTSFAKGKEIPTDVIDFDISDLKSGRDEAISIPISEYFNHKDNGIYTLTLNADDAFGRTISATMYISDVEFAYHCMTSDLEDVGEDKCNPISDEVV